MRSFVSLVGGVHICAYGALTRGPLIFLLGVHAIWNYARKRFQRRFSYMRWRKKLESRLYFGVPMLERHGARVCTGTNVTSVFCVLVCCYASRLLKNPAKSEVL